MVEHQSLPRAESGRTEFVYAARQRDGDQPEFGRILRRPSSADAPGAAAFEGIGWRQPILPAQGNCGGRQRRGE